MWGRFVLQFILILINAFLAASELAIVSLNENVLQYKAENGDAKAKKLLDVNREPTRFLSTIQVGITLASFLASAFAAESFSDELAHWAIGVLGLPQTSFAVANTVSVIFITLILSYFTIVLGELFPKKIAVKYPEKVALATMPLISFLSAAFKPLVALLTVSTNALAKLFKVQTSAGNDGVSEDVIKIMIDIGEEKGTIEAEEKEFINNIFDLNDITAADVMIHRTDMVVLALDSTHEEIISTIDESGLSRFPVFNESIDDISGIMRAREYLLNMNAEKHKPLKEILMPAYFVPETVKANQLLSDMRSKKIHMAIVVDEYGGTSGLVTLEDLLEEIVGQIYDESDPLDPAEIEKLDENLWRVDGGVNIDDLSEALGITIPENEDYDTLGGLMFSMLSFIPQDGSTPEVTAGGLNIKAEKIEDRRLITALISVVEQEEDKAE